MRGLTLAGSALALATSTFAQYLPPTDHFDAVTAPSLDENVPAGSDYTIKWDPGNYTTGTVTVHLIGGQSTTSLNPLEVLGDVDSAAGSLHWAVNATLGDLPIYGINITLDSNSSIYQYSSPFHIVGGSGSSNTTTTTTSSATVVSTTTPTPSSTGATNSNSTTTATTGSTTPTTSTSGTASSTTPTGAAIRAAAEPLAFIGGVIALVLAL